MPRRIEIVMYDPQWPRMYRAEADKLRPVFGSELISIHHIGSTAVPGLQAKPVIDIMVIIRDITKVHDFDAGMIRLGYRPRGQCLENMGTPGRYYFSKDTNGVRSHQTHVMEQGHFDIDDKLNFRDYLRSHPEVAAAYGKLKSKLARENNDGITEYMANKNSFVKEHITRATNWKNITPPND